MMRRIKRHLVALAAVVAVRMALWTLPFDRVRRACQRLPAAGTHHEPPATRLAATVAAVHRVARLIPGASCLTQALAAQWMLARTGIESELQFGATRTGRGLEAHAWLEVDGQRVLGDTPVAFTPLTNGRGGDVG